MLSRSGVTLVQICSKIKILAKSSEIFQFLTFLRHFEFLPSLKIYEMRNAGYPGYA
jgi:hypothetical protein